MDEVRPQKAEGFRCKVARALAYEWSVGFLSVRKNPQAVIGFYKCTIFSENEVSFELKLCKQSYRMANHHRAI